MLFCVIEFLHKVQKLQAKLDPANHVEEITILFIRLVLVTGCRMLVLARAGINTHV